VRLSKKGGIAMSNELYTQIVVVSIVALLGGLSGEIVTWLNIKDRPKSQRPQVTKSPNLSRLIAMPLIAAILVTIYQLDGSKLGYLASFNIGLSAPLIIRAMAMRVPTLSVNPDQEQQLPQTQ
jgi:hypothetical protein